MSLPQLYKKMGGGTYGGSAQARLERMFDRKGEGIREAPGGGHHVRIPLDVPDCAMGLLARRL